MRLFLIVIFILHTVLVSSQKPTIENDTYSSWPIVDRPLINNDHKYILYTISNAPVGGFTLVIQSTVNNWKKEIIGASLNDAVFLPSGRCVILKPRDSLCILTLGTEKIEYISDASNFRIDTQNNREWLAYTLKSNKGILVLFDLLTKRSKSFYGVIDYEFAPHGKNLILRREDTVKRHYEEVLQLIDLENDRTIDVWRGTKIGQYEFDATGEQIAFSAQKDFEGYMEAGIWYFKIGGDIPQLFFSSKSTNIELELMGDKCQFLFNKSGKYIVINLKYILKKSAESHSKVDIWTFNDAKLQSLQLNELSQRMRGWIGFSYNIQENRIAQLTQNEETIISDLGKNTGDFLLVSDNKGDPREWHWNIKNRTSVYLVAIKDGSRTLLTPKANLSFFYLSACGRYVIYFDSKENNYYCYDIARGVYHNVTKNIPAIWTVSYEWPGDKYLPLSLIYWTDKDQDLILCSQYDIWQVDPRGERKAICLTNQYGKDHNIEFRISGLGQGDQLYSNDKILVKVHDKSNKENGFSYIYLGKQKNPEKLIMGPYVYSWEMPQPISGQQKINDSEMYLIKRESTTEAPNYYITNNFTYFKPISNVQPQKMYNWMSSELMVWKTFDGQASQGILYKPEDFNPQKKYPIVFHIYERMSDNLNIFLFPEPPGTGINIPNLVSNGYLVFEPDIHYTIGHPGKSAYKYLVSAAKYLSGFSWIDSKKIGIEGHSFGGFEVNYLITHSHLFSAAISGSGMTDFVSAYGSIIGDGSSRQRQYEIYRERIGATLWQRPDLYLENSPVLRADQIITPLLLMCNQSDWDVPYAQGVELFTALRRLNRAAWMLQYDNEGHWLNDSKNKEDFSLRTKQFLDHFLKGVPAPIWLSKGVPARLKGSETGLELEN